jgi:hypothetical protein
MTNSFIEISSNGGRIGRIAWSNHPIFGDTFGRVYWSHWPFSFEIERTVVEGKPRKLRAKYT